MSDKFPQAASKLVEVSIEFESELRNIITINDLCVYIALLGLVSFPRKRIIDFLFKNPKVNVIFESVTELSPLLESFCNNRYKSFIDILNRIPKFLEFDSFIGDKGGILIEKIIEKTMILFISPYKTLDLKFMSAQMSIPLAELEIKLADLSTSGLLKIRIDSHKKVDGKLNNNITDSICEERRREGEKLQNSLRGWRKVQTTDNGNHSEVIIQLRAW